LRRQLLSTSDIRQTSRVATWKPFADVWDTTGLIPQHVCNSRPDVAASGCFQTDRQNMADVREDLPRTPAGSSGVFDSPRY